MFLGIDIGAQSIKIVLLDKDKKIIHTSYFSHFGEPSSALYKNLLSLEERGIGSLLEGGVVCGSGASLLKDNLIYRNEVVAIVEGINFFFSKPTCTVIDIGAQTAKLILLKEGKLADFKTNTICAAGTGSFLEQQANRLKLSLSDFAQLAIKSKYPARVAGRCSVFAKSDMIHLQQEACPIEDIISGLCYAFVRNFKSSLAATKSIFLPLIFIGGVSANLGIIHAFKKLWELKEEDLIIPEYSKLMSALGAAILAKELTHPFSLADIKESLKIRQKRGITQSLPILLKSKEKEDRVSFKESNLDKEKLFYLGVDVGSISTNLVIMNDSGEIVTKRYLMTKGRPVEVVKEGLLDIYKELTHKYNGDYIIGGVCTTGSGRYLIGEILGADLVKNEITAQARAACFIDPSVETIFEIGGQDSKYISLEDGAIVDFEMNKVCAAGTGSFLEEQAEHLNLEIKSDFQEAAFKSSQPADLGERCTVFMETALITQQQQGVPKEDLAAGLCYSIAKNYLQKVVQNKKIGDKIFFQGGVALNKGVKAAFQNILQKEIIVPPHNEVTGAWGCCLLARENYKKTKKESSFLGFKKIVESNYSFSSFECNYCPNHCLIHKVEQFSEEYKRELFYGGRCERYEAAKKRKEASSLPDLFQEWEAKTFKSSSFSSPVKVAMPRSLLFYELYPFFYEFFSSLGLEIILSPPSRRQALEEGLSNISAQDPCFPVKLAHAHLSELLSSNVEVLFLPSIINLASFDSPLQDRRRKKDKSVFVEGGWEQSYACPYEQTLPYLFKAAFQLDNKRVLIPSLRFAWSDYYWRKPLIQIAQKEFGFSYKKAKEALKSAEDAFREYRFSLKKRGEEILNSLSSQTLVLIGRPYNVHDKLINLNIPQKLKEEGKLLIPMDYLPYHEVSPFFPNMYWHYGQKILAAAEIIRKNPYLFPIYLTNFGCGPDSFLLSFFKEVLQGEKPLLIIEVDEHSAPAGIITRLEAYIESIANYRKKPKEKKFKKDYLLHIKKEGINRRIYIPYMSDHAIAVKAAMRACGVDAEVMPKQDEETLIWGRKYTSGRECYPCIITTGDMVKMTKRADFEPKKSAFFLGGSSGPCRFGQYSMLQRLVLDELGFSEVPIYAPNQARDFYGELKKLGKNFAKYAWEGIVAIDLLQKCLFSLRPLDKSTKVEEVYSYYIKLLEDYIEKRKDIKDLLKRAAYDFSCLKIEGEKRPIVGIVGEIFVRANPFSNEDIIRQIEALGAQVRIAPVYEWFLYRNFRRKMHSIAHRDLFCLISTSIRHKLQKRIEINLGSIFEEIIEDAHEPTTEEVLNLASPYISCFIEGEAILSIGKAIDFIKSGVSGIINVMPFTCMPGTITTGLLKKVEEDYKVPILNIAYDGLKQANTPLRLEAFIYQISAS